LLKKRKRSTPPGFKERSPAENFRLEVKDFRLRIEVKSLASNEVFLKRSDHQASKI